ncbi:hypothetical protein ATE84_5303 [Aquimarina sp. MAR_2010_214]|uniref:hypothetical protein n=1 Tax=Aquimarina sp. MAR_2010_214 TaxID=1250026 RepID=UPI000C708010|nr:hypothetical protein [Aquimarina sp. MAR_2010_214]PKV53167.1 hypothetical protein ATE84_5303 [Aquimarina sp. MAR_2010_214]
MKYNQYSKKGQEDRKHLLTDAFGSVLGMGLYTSVVTPLPKVITESNGGERLEETLQFISKNFREVVVNDSFASCKVFVS